MKSHSLKSNKLKNKHFIDSYNIIKIHYFYINKNIHIIIGKEINNFH